MIRRFRTIFCVVVSNTAALLPKTIGPAGLHLKAASNMESMKMHRISLGISFVAVSLISTVALACNVPVFRYALERWPADLYEVIVLHDGELSESDAMNVKLLVEQSRTEDGVANFNLRTIDVSEVKDDLLRDAWKEHGHNAQSVIAILYPRNAQDVPDRLVTATPLTVDSVHQLTDSPARQKLVNELLSGESAVWVFVPGGDQQQDDAALARLHDQVARSEKELKLPPQDEIEADDFFRIENPIELRLGFSVITLDVDDPKEQFFLAMLLGSEADLETSKEPMAFPVIGRGRVLYALVGKGIFPDTIKSASRFVVGPCSCQVKEQNPGFDLLLSVPWDQKLGGAIISEPALERSNKPVLIDIPPGK